MAVSLMYPLQLSSSPQNSVLNKRGLQQPSIALKPTSRIPVQKSSILCSTRRGKDTSAAATPTTRTPSVPSVPVGLPDPKRSQFPPPPDFYFGAATSAYQIEGAWNVDGKEPSIWDHFTQNYLDKIDDKTNGDVACDSYNRIDEDIKKMKEIGLEAYRFSIAWSRILPDGTRKGGINEKGIAYYNKLINKLIDNGIEPIVTLFHWDVPLALENKYRGFLCSKIVDDFKDYANVCFQQFGNRVKHWITINEPWTFATHGYYFGWHAPGRGFDGVGKGDSEWEPYIVAHNLILAHGVAAKLYKDKYQSMQRGQVGMAPNTMYFFPWSKTPASEKAVHRALEFYLGWFVEPLITGDYPVSMRESITGDRLPEFTEAEKEIIIGSYDYLGINYYTSMFAKDPAEEPVSGPLPAGYFGDMNVDQRDTDVNGNPTGEKHGSWIYVAPEGFRKLLRYVKDKYNDPEILITENGTSQIDHPEKEGLALPRDKALEDHQRIEYIKPHIENIRLARDEDKVKVVGYLVWSLQDNFEWPRGYTERFGLVYIDYARGLERVLKKSGSWYSDFLKS